MFKFILSFLMLLFFNLVFADTCKHVRIHLGFPKDKQTREMKVEYNWGEDWWDEKFDDIKAPNFWSSALPKFNGKSCFQDVVVTVRDVKDSAKYCNFKFYQGAAAELNIDNPIEFREHTIACSALPARQTDGAYKYDVIINLGN